ncbi:MAG: TVP38/TMEM64 family protein [Magnetococcales bacterium]|nr:TVP38/TMEM64 family protein [Magnetococcales bacterium]
MNSKALIRIVVVLVLIGAIAWAATFRDELSPEAIQAWVSSFGYWGPVVFIGIYAIASVLFLPGSVLTLTGGALFGPVLGTLYNLSGATIGATLAFLIARYLASDWVEQKAGGRLKRLFDGVEQEGWKFVAFVRLVPVFPFNLLNYALGLTKIRLSHYIIASFICMLPGGFAYTYLGFAGKEALAGGDDLLQKGLLALGLLAAVAFLPSMIKRMRKQTDAEKVVD